MSSESPPEITGLEDTLAFGPRATPEAVSEPEPAKQIGPYRLLQLIGEGGMGEVWLAEQLEPRRSVAVKVIKAGMDTREVVARFESERQALALMDHPAIAKVFDGGSTPEGRPYFVMEYVAGVPITEHCDTHRLPTEARLRLLMEVCEGVQHAHQKAIIHRDLKPSNILVSLLDGRAQVKIIDFGIAKAVGHRLTEKTLFTELGAVIGTPEYMSPEQADASGQDVDTRTDVYSLGVLLYQLLTGELPFGSRALRSSSDEDLRRMLREVEPPRPSARLSTLGDAAAEAAERRHTEPGALRRRLEGDLDAITMKALEKERARRYGTPSELAADIGRHLRHEPVLARPASAAYRLRRYVKRHRLGVGAAVGLAALLVAFAVTMGIEARRTALERDRANREREASEKVSAFLANMLSSVNPEELGDALWKDLHQRVATEHRRRGEGDEEVTATLASLDHALLGLSPTETALHLLDEQILDRAGRTLKVEMGGEPRIAGSLEHTLGRTYLSLGLYPQAEQHFQRAIELRTTAFGQGSIEALRSMNGLAAVYARQGRLEEAEKVFRETLEAARRLLGPDDRFTLSSMGNLANVYDDQGRYQESTELNREALEARRRVLGPDHPDTLASMNNLVGAYREQGRLDEAERLGRETVEAKRRVLGAEHPDTLMSMSNLANVYFDQGRYEEGAKLHRETLEARRRVLGPEHPETLDSMHNLAGAYERQGRLREAEQLHRETLEARRRILGPDHPDTLSSMTNLATVYERAGRLDEATTLAQEAVRGYERTKLEHGREMGAARAALGHALAGLKRFAQAEEELTRAERLIPARSAQHRACLEELVALYEAWETSEPHRGHSAQVAAWRAKLDGSR